MAVFLRVPAVLAVAVTVMTCAPPLGNAATLPVTLFPETFTVQPAAPPVAAPQTAVTPVRLPGTGSLKVAPPAGLGPLLRTVRV